MKSKTIKELLIEIRRELLNSRLYFAPEFSKTYIGICGVIEYSGIFTPKEKCILEAYLTENAPKRIVKVTKDMRKKLDYEYEPDLNISMCWYDPYLIAPRLKWLTRQINKL